MPGTNAESVDTYRRGERAVCLLIIILLFSSTRTSEGAFKDSFLGAKSMAMGGAYAALSDDVDGALVNPAGISMIEDQQIAATMAALYMGLSDDSFISQNVVGYAYKYSWIGTLGAVWKRLAAGNLYSENILALSFGRFSSLYLTKSDKERRKNFSYGATLKFMSWDSAPTVGSDGRIIEDLPGWRGFSFDVGLVFWPSENTPVALVLQNVTRPDVASDFSMVRETLPIAARMGVAAIAENVTWAMDMILKEGQLDLRTGLEKRAYGTLFLRTGLSLENLAWGMNFTIGAGYKPSDSVRIDYAFVYPVNTILNTAGSHRVSVVYNFGSKK